MQVQSNNNTINNRNLLTYKIKTGFLKIESSFNTLTLVTEVIEGIIQAEMKILPRLSHPCVIPNLQCFLFPEKHKGEKLAGVAVKLHKI